MSNTDIYKKNIETLNVRNKNVVYFLENESEAVNNPEDGAIEAYVQLIGDNKVLAVEKDGQCIQLSSMYDDEVLATKWFKNVRANWDLDAQLHMYGLGTGCFARTFLKMARKDCSIVVFEPSYAIFKKVIEEYDISDILLDTRFRLVFGPMLREISIKGFYESIISYADTRTMSFSCYLNYTQLFPKNCDEYLDALMSVQSFAASNQYVNSRFGLDFNNNLFSNYKLQFPNSYSMSSLKNILADREDIPVIVVAAGPSLDKNIEFLKEAKNKSIIIAADTALRPLGRNGIIPDIAVALDGKKDARYMSEEATREVPLVCELRTGRDILNAHKGRKYFIGGDRTPVGKYCKEKGIEIPDIPTGASVANLCFSVGLYFGCKTLIFVGQDLAYTDAKTHSQSTVRGEVHTKEEDLQHVVWGEDIYGNPIRTSGEFIIYKEWFEEHMTINPTVKYIDSTEGGIYIKGTEVMPLKDSIAKYCKGDIDFSKIINDVAPLFDEDGRKDYLSYLESITDELDKAEKLVRETLGQYIQLGKLVKSNNYHNGKTIGIFKKCEENTALLEKMTVMNYIRNQLQDKETELFGTINKIEQDERAELVKVCEIGENHFSDTLNAINEIREILKVYGY